MDNRQKSTDIFWQKVDEEPYLICTFFPILKYY